MRANVFLPTSVPAGVAKSRAFLVLQVLGGMEEGMRIFRKLVCMIGHVPIY